VKCDEAIALDPTNDKVKIGRQETRRHWGHLEHALREGYEHNVRREYAAAIDSFDRVLAIFPSHAQAKRYRREACIELANAAEAHGDYEEAIKKWRFVLDSDLGNKDAIRR